MMVRMERTLSLVAESCVKSPIDLGQPIDIGLRNTSLSHVVAYRRPKAHAKWRDNWGDRSSMKLTNRQIKNAEAGKYQDGRGLFLLKRDKARGFWHFRFSLDGKRPEMGLGAWPEVSLAEARDAANAARELVRKGINPIAERKDSELRRKGIPTLSECIYDAYEARKASLRGEGKAGRWLSPLEMHVIPKIGSLPVTEIDQNVITEALRPLWRTKYPTADKAIGRINIALEYAVAQGHEVNLNAVKMARILLGDSGHKVEHHPAMPWQEVPAFYQALGAGSTVRRVLAFMILTGGAGRTAPVRLARYEQIKGDQWTIPGELMKGMEGKTQDFRVPLNEPALELIETCKKLTGGEWIFPGPSGKPITDVMTSRFMKETPYTPHGFRSTFRDWMAHIGVPFEIAETAIAHQVGSKVTRAYLRDDYFEKRRVIMHDWAKHLSGEGSADVLRIHKP